MIANSTTKGTVLLSRLSNYIGVTTRSMARSLQIGNSVQDNVEDNRFELAIGNEDVAFVEYELQNNVYDLIESSVPDKYSGQGLGKILARKTFDHIISQNGKIKLSCDFLIHFYNQNRDEYKSHIV